MSWEDYTRDEQLQRAIRDAAVHDSMTTHAPHIPDNVDRRMVHEIAMLAVHNALTMYAANHKQAIARIESFERERTERYMMGEGRLQFMQMMAAQHAKSGDPRHTSIPTKGDE